MRDALDMTLLDEAVAASPARTAASSRRFALATRHPDVGRVDPETWWLGFREGANWAMRQSAALSPMLQTAAELIVLLGQSQEDAGG